MMLISVLARLDRLAVSQHDKVGGMMAKLET
jgi:hypothetical protein